MELEISKRYYSCSFHKMTAIPYQDIDYYGGIQAITFPTNSSSFNILWHFEILTWE